MENILETPEGLIKAFTEVNKIKNVIHTVCNSWNIELKIKENEHKGFDLIFDNKTLLMQFYYPYQDAAVSSYLIFVIGNSQPNNKIEPIEISYFDFGVNNEEFGWIERDEKKEFYSSNNITNIWMSKFGRITNVIKNG